MILREKSQSCSVVPLIYWDTLYIVITRQRHRFFDKTERTLGIFLQFVHVYTFLIARQRESRERSSSIERDRRLDVASWKTKFHRRHRQIKEVILISFASRRSQVVLLTFDDSISIVSDAQFLLWRHSRRRLVGIVTLNQLESTIIQLLIGNSVASKFEQRIAAGYRSVFERRRIGKELWIVSRREFLRKDTPCVRSPRACFFNLTFYKRGVSAVSKRI